MGQKRNQTAARKVKPQPKPQNKLLPPEKNFISTREAAKMLGLAVATVQKMVDSGALQAWITAGGHRRIHAGSVQSLLASNRQNKMPPVPGSRLSVLIAEDDPTQGSIYRASISSWGLPIDLKIVSDGFTAIIEASKSTPDVMVIDLMMPKTNGFDLIRCVRSDPVFNNTDLLVITGLYPEEIMAAGGVPPDVVVIEKPVPFEMLHGFMRARLAAKLRGQPPK